MAEVVETTTRTKLPAAVPLTIIVGATFRSQIFRHRNPDTGDYIDTSGWVFDVPLLDSGICGAAELLQFTVEQQPAPKYGYRLTLTEVLTAGLDCALRAYWVRAFDGATYTKYFAAPVTVTGG